MLCEPHATCFVAGRGSPPIVMHGIALASSNHTEDHHDHAGNTAMLLGSTYNIPTDSITGSATHH